MKNRRFFWVLFLLGLASTSAHAQDKEIIGYYPAWQLRARNYLVTSKTLPYEKLTTVNFAFFYPLPDGTIVGVDTLAEATERILLGEKDPASGDYLPNTSLVELAHKKGIKVLLSIGGWADSKNFPAVAARVESRRNFAHWCARHVRRYGLDGVDIDWEYPGYAPHNGTPADKENFTLLLQAVRDSLNALGNRMGKYYVLTAALPADPDNTANIEVSAIAKILDQLNIMTYDLFGAWFPISNHNAPLYAPAKGDTTRNLNFAFHLYHNYYGVPARKINLGVPFYGRSYMNCTALHAPHAGSDTLHFPGAGVPLYYEILPVMDHFTRYWDERARVPYLISTEWRTFLSYDDEISVAEKAKYVLDRDAGGLIIWEITGDYLPDGSTPLLDAIYNTFYGNKK